jgi:hypothetical protein
MFVDNCSNQTGCCFHQQRRYRLNIEIIGAGEGIRTLDPNLGKIRPDQILFLDQIVI